MYSTVLGTVVTAYGKSSFQTGALFLRMISLLLSLLPPSSCTRSISYCTDVCASFTYLYY
jgi:hypothetical protein